jgi:hypothetical protein
VAQSGASFEQITQGRCVSEARHATTYRLASARGPSPLGSGTWEDSRTEGIAALIRLEPTACRAARFSSMS